MTFTKQITAARQIDAFRSFAAQIKHAHVARINGEVLVTVMQPNSNGVDCRWTANSEASARAELIEQGYQEVGA